MRFILYGDAAYAAGRPGLGAPLAEEPCRAMLQAARATLWLAPMNTAAGTTQLGGCGRGGARIAR